MIELIEKQKEIYNHICKIKNGEEFYRKNNFVLLGAAGTGKTTILKKLSKKNEFTYINFSKDHFKKFLTDNNLSIRYLTSNDFFKFIENEFGFSSSLIILDSIDPIIISLYNNGEKKIVQFFDNLFEQETYGGVLLSITKYETINFDLIFKKSKLREKNIFRLKSDDKLNSHLGDIYKLPTYRINNFKNNHYFRLYRSD